MKTFSFFYHNLFLWTLQKFKHPDAHAEHPVSTLLGFVKIPGQILQKSTFQKLISLPMNREGPIIFIEDDLDDQEIFHDVFKDLDYGNEIIFFPDGEAALDYLNENDVEPFIIFSDINMPKLNGMELRSKILENEHLRIKTIPYLFFSTSNEQQHVVDAYSKSIQGFFTKPSAYNEIKELLQSIIEYWQKCVSPNYIR